MMKLGALLSCFLLQLSIATASIITVGSNGLDVASGVGSIVQTIRRSINLGSTFGSVSSTNNISPYERITGHPVFAVTTSWGSPYMTMEKVTQDETIPTPSSLNDGNKKKPTSLSEEQIEYRRVALYFLDPADAIAVHNEMIQQQSEPSQSLDIRITSFSLAKAIRQASILGYGLPTGAPPDPLTGNFNVEEGATLRYKLVPSKKQLYYAARCTGKERVGLCSSTPTGPKEDAVIAIMGNSALEAANLARRREQRERKIPLQQPNVTAMNADHMIGYSGIPVFYCPNMQRPVTLVQQFMTGFWTRRRYEIPLFFNYEDLITAWGKLSSNKATKTLKLPEEPPIVEVFNLWDVVTSMDRYQSNMIGKGGIHLWKERLMKRKKGDRQRRNPMSSSPQDIIFVPNSDSTHYKDAISRRGNGKARLRPMRESVYRPLR
jgi:hypothetical protein